ncbi:MAG TPA: hypothetical protein PLD10_08505 [Rhodopila sp.]|nr:hypothetical protein [Rhodopila sp.]
MLILVHETRNRMRFNSPAIKLNPDLAAALVAAVRAVRDVTGAHHNPLTGSLIVHHSGTGPARDAILEQLAARMDVTVGPVPAQRAGASVSPASLTTEAIAAALMDAVIKRIVGHSLDALVAAIL